jgi:para-nitrobenzyl esterase
VTIFGHSAGSAAVAFLSASPLSKGLFHKVIAMSGSSFTPLQTSDKDVFGMSIPSLKYAEATGTAFLNKLGVTTIAEARALPPDKIQAATGGGLAFRPVADGHVVAQDLYSIYEQRKFNDTPLLIGDTSDETLAFGGARSITSAEFEAQIRSQFGSDAAAILKAYPHGTDAEAARASRHVRNATTFLWTQWTWAREQSKQGKSKVFGYYYDNHAPTADGSGHGSDVPFAFQTLVGGRRTPSASDLALSEMMSSYYVNFATTGDPNGKGLPAWPAFTEKNEQVMVFDAMPSARTYPALEQVKAFEPFFEQRRKER